MMTMNVSAAAETERLLPRRFHFPISCALPLLTFSEGYDRIRLKASFLSLYVAAECGHDFLLDLTRKLVDETGTGCALDASFPYNFPACPEGWQRSAVVRPEL